MIIIIFVSIDIGFLVVIKGSKTDCTDALNMSEKDENFCIDAVWSDLK